MGSQKFKGVLENKNESRVSIWLENIMVERKQPSLRGSLIYPVCFVYPLLGGKANSLNPVAHAF